MKKLLLLLFVISIGFFNAEAQDNSALNEVVASEKAFAAMAAEKGTKAAFLQYSADNAFMFNPKPVNAKEFWNKRAESVALLAWTPNFAAVSSNGEMGFTTGTAELRPKGKADAPTWFGDFATIWKKQPDESWKWVLDIGIDHAKPENQAVWSQLILLPVGKDSKPAEKNFWRELEDDFALLIKKNGAVKAFEKSFSERVRLLRQNHLPYDGKKDAVRILAVESGTLRMNPLMGEAAADLAYAYGEYDLTDAAGKTEKGQYLRVWKRESKDWRIVFDLSKPFPAAQK